MLILNLIIVFGFGACIGSFLNVLIWRLPRNEKPDGRSHCAHCGHQLAAGDLLPVISFLFLRGRCRYCKYNISVRYPFIEIITATLFTLAFWLLIPQALLSWFLIAKIWFAIAVLVVVFVVDLEHYLILDSIIFPGTLLLLLLNFCLDSLKSGGVWHYPELVVGGIAASLAAALPFYLIWYFSKGRYLGFGDVKLMLFLGMSVGWPLIWVNLFLAVISGGVFSLFLLLFGGKSLKSRLPFGTFLSLAAVLTLFFGQSLLHWYLALLGF